MRHRAVHAAIVALAVLALGASAAAQGGPASSARAIGVRVVLPDGTVAAAAAVNAPPRGGASLDGWSYGDGAVVTGSISTSARTGAGSGSATANGSASVRSVSLFGGEVTAGAVSVQADARAAGSGASGSLSPSSVSDLVVLGQAAGASANGRVPLGDWGYAVMLEQAVVRTTSPRRG
ncbi:MAG: choice-of-anchor P family protein, partial [Gaiellaceae bacterium]